MAEEFETIIKTCPEIKLYFIIDAIGAMRWRLNHDMADGRIPESEHAALDKSIKEAAIQQQEAVGQLTRFGVSPFVEGTKSPSESYWQWFHAWDHYIKHELSNEEWNELNRKLSVNEDISEYKPKGGQ